MAREHIRRLERIEARCHAVMSLTEEEILIILAAMTRAALEDDPEAVQQVIAYLSDGSLEEAKEILQRASSSEMTGEDRRYILTPQAVSGVIYLLMNSVLDSDKYEQGNIADRMRKPLKEYCGENTTLEETVVLLLYDLTSDYMVFRDHPVAFGCMCLRGGHGFRID